MDPSSLCRSCMKEVASWERENFDERVIYMFNYSTNIQISDTDPLPKQFCYDCTIKIESTYTYIKEAHHVNELLTNLLTPRTVIVTKYTELTSEQYETNETPTLEDEPINEVVVNETVINEVVVNEPVINEQLETNECVSVNINETETIESAPKSIIKCKSSVEDGKGKTFDQKYVCAICQKTFLSKVWYEKHLRNQHNGKVYSCSECNKTFQKQSQLTVHSVTHSAERRYLCACGKRYKRRKELTVHARTHSAARPYQCDHCSMSFKLKSVLKSHLALHEPDKPHLCYICGWSFKQAGNLSVHMRTHTGIKPHTCACGYRASCATSLRRHKARHTQTRAHRCRACAKGFHDKAALTRHERSHTGARPYLCPAPGCARGFVDSWKRKLHLMRAHRVPLAAIPRLRADPDQCVP